MSDTTTGEALGALFQSNEVLNWEEAHRRIHEERQRREREEAQDRWRQGEERALQPLDQLRLSGCQGHPVPHWVIQEPRMAHERLWHSAVALDPHRILIVGGNDADRNDLGSTEVFDVTSMEWHQDWPELNRPRSYHATVLCQDKVYVLGGHDGQQALDSIEYLDLTSTFPQWTVLQNARMSCPRAGCAAVMLGDMVYIMGGWDGSTRQASVDMLDTTTGTLREGPPMLTPRTGCAAGVIHNTIYVVGGEDTEGNKLDTIESFSTERGEWQMGPSPMSTARSCAGLTVVAHCLVVMGGDSEDAYLSSAEVYDTKRGVWWSLPEMEEARYGAAAVTLGESRVVVMGGSRGVSAHDTMEWLDLELALERSGDKQELQKRLSQEQDQFMDEVEAGYVFVERVSEQDALDKSAPATEQDHSLPTDPKEGSHAAPSSRDKDLHQELKEQKALVKELQDALKIREQEMESMTRESKRVQLEHDSERASMSKELLTQGERYKESLSKKEDELQALREKAGDRVTEGPWDETDESGTNVKKLREELQKAVLDNDRIVQELKTKQASLANAKMVISSLESANRSTVEDLRQRLQDSNMAIAGLQEKLAQSEQEVMSLRTELELVKKEKHEEAGNWELKLQKLQGEMLEQIKQVERVDSRRQLFAGDHPLRSMREESSASRPSPSYNQMSSRMRAMAPPGKFDITWQDSKGNPDTGRHTTTVFADKISPGEQVATIDDEDENVSLLPVSKTTGIERTSPFESQLAVMTAHDYGAQATDTLKVAELPEKAVSQIRQEAPLHNDLQRGFRGWEETERARSEGVRLGMDANQSHFADYDDGRIVTTAKLKVSGEAIIYQGTMQEKDGSTHDVVIKVVKNESNWDACKREAKALLRISRHPNVMDILDIFEEPEPCFVMRFVPGTGLRSFLNQHGRLIGDDALQLLKGVGEGLHHLHAHDIVHRDLTSPNILLEATGSTLRPVLIDLGLGKTVEVEGRIQAQWRAPELIEHNSCSKKTDMYSLGIIMWEVLTGEIPYADKGGLWQILYFVMGANGRPDASKLTRVGVSEAHRKLVESLWHTESSKRPSTEEFLVLIDSGRGDSDVGEQFLRLYSG